MNKKTSKSYLGILFIAASLNLLGGCSSTPTWRTPPSPTSQADSEAYVLRIALGLVGTPYHYGGDSPREGFDCSGLVYYSHLKAGIRLPRTSYGQYKATRPVSRRHLRPGDLVFFRIQRYKISHVGIYVGHGEFIHAPSSGKKVSIDELTDPYWQRRFIRGGRPL
jgi:cell wall-associated NlpC family hydrolase